MLKETTTTTNSTTNVGGVRNNNDNDGVGDLSGTVSGNQHRVSSSATVDKKQQLTADACGVLRFRTLGPCTDTIILRKALNHSSFLTIGRFVEETGYSISSNLYNMVLARRHSTADVRLSNPNDIGIDSKRKLEKKLRQEGQKVITSGDEYIINRPTVLRLLHFTEDGYRFMDNCINLFELYCKYVYIYDSNRRHGGGSAHTDRISQDLEL